MKLNINSGYKYNYLVIIKEVEHSIGRSGQTQRRFLCKCELCGSESIKKVAHFTRGYVKSCGCFAKKANGQSTEPLYIKWKGIMARCKSTHIDKHIYYDRGIKMCEEWSNDYNIFKEWCLNNGYSGELVIDRIDNEKGYSPDNCRFVTVTENANNKRNSIMVNYNGKLTPISIAVTDKFGSKKNHYETILGRIKRGWNHQKAFDTPIRKGNYLTAEQRRKSKILTKE